MRRDNHKPSSKEGAQAAIASMHDIQTFITCLANSDKEGTILIAARMPETKDDSANIKTTLKYQLLNPANVFHDVSKEPRALILAGGTMAPVEDFRTMLMPDLEGDLWATHDYGHVISKDNLFLSVVKSGPSNVKLEFTHGERGNLNMVICLTPEHDMKLILISSMTWDRPSETSRTSYQLAWSFLCHPTLYAPDPVLERS